MILVGFAGTTPPDVPDVPVEPSEPVAFGLRLSWSAPWLGKTWELSSSTSTILHVMGQTLLGPAPVVHAWSESPALDGSTWERARYDRLPVALPLLVAGESTAEFIEEHAAFVRACNPRQVSILRVTRPDGSSWRELECRYESGLDAGYERDPAYMMQAAYMVEWVAPDPFWRGEPVSAYFPYVTTPTLFPGPPWVLAPNRTLSNATITNPGDEDSYPTWRVDGPFTSFTVGIGAAVVSLTRTMTAGQWISVDMTPGVLTIKDQAGVDRWDDVTAVEFAPIPPGTSNLVTSVVGSAAGSGVTLTFTPRYSTAW